MAERDTKCMLCKNQKILLFFTNKLIVICEFCYGKTIDVNYKPTILP